MYLIDAEQVVHMSFCRDAVEPCLPYRTKTEDMHAWLSRPDTHERHAAPALISACELCIVPAN